MDRVGAFEAKTHLSKLLDRVAKGERIVIERYGVPVAVLHPPAVASRKPVGETIAELKQFRGKHRLGGLSIRELLDEGRK
ncbi:MAG: type II toxin-antitoxin system prevent-host-death family antitoxin [Candidatus Hydrogenedentota bacterium]